MTTPPPTAATHASPTSSPPPVPTTSRSPPPPSSPPSAITSSTSAPATSSSPSPPTPPKATAPSPARSTSTPRSAAISPSPSTPATRRASPVPATITIPAGITSVPLPLSLIDDALLNGPETITVSATSATAGNYAAQITLHDNETAALAITFPSTAKESDGSITGTVTASAPPTTDIGIKLASSNTGKVTVPATVTLKAGTTAAIFSATLLDNHIIDGTVLAAITASVDNWTSGSANISIQDVDNTITLALPTSGWEGQSFANGTITLGGTLTTPLVINLSSNKSSEISLPATVTIPAGQISATFSFSLLQDGLKAGIQNVTVTAAATGLSNGTANISVHDATLDHIAFEAITGNKTAGTTFAITHRAFNVANETIITYAGSATLTATGAGNLSIPVSPASFPFTAGIAATNANITIANPAVTLSATSGGANATSAAFAVQPGAVSSFTWGNITSPQIAGLPFQETLTAKDVFGNPATNYNGSASLTGIVGTVTSQTMLGNLTFTNSNNSGTFTVGYAFTPSSNMQVTAVRTYFGSKVSFWTDTGTLLASQAVTSTPTAWTETSLATSITLLAGTTYRITVYTAGLLYYWRNVAPTNPPFASLGQTYEVAGDVFPTSTDTGQYWLVDLRANVGSGASIPVTPATAAFSNGIWTGNITVNQAAAAMHLHVDDGLAHTADSSNFDVIQRTLTFSLPSDVRENNGAAFGQLSVSPTPTADLTLTLSSSDAARLGVPATLTIPAGQNVVAFPLSIIDNSLLDGPESITLTASTPGYANASGTIKFHDNETATLSLAVPTSVNEGISSYTANISVSAPPARDIVVALTSSNPLASPSPPPSPFLLARPSPVSPSIPSTTPSSTATSSSPLAPPSITGPATSPPPSSSTTTTPSPSPSPPPDGKVSPSPTALSPSAVPSPRISP